MKQLGRSDYPDVMKALLMELGGSGKADLVVVCGMAGARGGWHEVPYLPCPCTAVDVANHCVRIGVDISAATYIVPGLSCEGRGTQDILRGEETQALGVVESTGETSLLAVMPGTHSKWIVVENGSVNEFRTYMTGEIYDVMTSHSILSRFAAAQAHDESAFRQGVQRSTAVESVDGGWGLLFSARSNVIAGLLPESGAFSYLSGLLIGLEAREALMRFRPEVGKPVVVCGDQKLARLYVDTLEIHATNAKALEADASSLGLWQLANHLREKIHR
jgi:2-dehydro-3-deoxygalactonokinase